MSNKLKIKGDKKVEINIDQDKVLDDVINKIEYTMIKDILVNAITSYGLTNILSLNKSKSIENL